MAINADNGLISADVTAGGDATAAEYNGVRTDIKKLRSESLTAGETISVASLPQAVYQKASDGKIYNSVATSLAAAQVIGFALTGNTVNNPVVVQHTGVVDGFSGLTPGAAYYTTNTPGAISTTPGTNVVQVGYAISATQILIIQPRQYAAGVMTTATSITAQNIDSQIVLGFVPRFIKLKYYLIGHDNPTQTNAYFIRRGEAIFSMTTLVSDKIDIGAQRANGGSSLVLYTGNDSVDNTTAAFLSAGDSSGSGGVGIKILLSVLSINAAGFTIRNAFTISSGGSIAQGESHVAWEAWA